MKHYQVVAAIIIYDNKILCLKKSKHKYSYISHKWEFPGGKVEQNETQEEAIVREIKEELGMTISVKKHFISNTHHYPDFKITLHSYLCDTSSQQLTLTEHSSYRWLKTSELAHLDWAKADIPIADKLEQEKTHI